MVDITKLAHNLAEAGKSEERVNFDVQPIPGEIEVLQVLVDGRAELPVYISVAEDEILCIVHLFKDQEVKTEKSEELHLDMLAMNVPMPLSSFAKIGDQYVVFGALSVGSDLATIVQEIETLTDNSLEAIEALGNYLK